MLFVKNYLKILKYHNKEKKIAAEKFLLSSFFGEKSGNKNPRFLVFYSGFYILICGSNPTPATKNRQVLKIACRFYFLSRTILNF